MAQETHTRVLLLGLVGGVAGTIAMDLVLAGVFSLAGIPADLTFSFIGDTASIFFSKLGLDVAGGVPLGMGIHYLIGAVLGLIFGVLVSRFGTLRLGTLKKGIGLGILYIEIVSLPILATAPLLNEMTPADTLQWFGLSFAMHLVCGAVLGAVVSNAKSP